MALRGRDALLLPWVQDFSFSTQYGIDEVRAQIYSARLAGAKGYLLWNPEGVHRRHTDTAVGKCGTPAKRRFRVSARQVPYDEPRIRSGAWRRLG